ncbi:tripartite tricarboxylate transporter permease [Allokutzneria sp. A3M-2-11 16]|uniref:tripartite tricarboxylate transporter permease n=1 Tax=Allokutzneria sp. A3M-2-11 16 TaxID=2962043 RepID=UPI0020B8038C|nr:tripartite tricarboxylate transporter permease [Allokutzneria sp. A3M-2-11 16]MCP3799183.1 tripartite tricarboxylate transporter permease [Allokutzneria sp. A3M-2-11 16]
MDTLTQLLNGFGTALTPINLLYAVIGVLLGTAIGVLPGIGPAMAVALLLPVTYGLDPTGSFIMFAGIYYGGMFGGSTTSILLNTPGETAAVVTAIEGNPMARKGRGAQALATAAIGHFVGGIIGTTLLVLLAPFVASVAVDIGAPDYFAIMLLAFIAVTSVLGGSRVRGFASLLIGLAIGLVGLDEMTGQQRLTFGSLQLADGIDVVVVAVGLFAIGESLWVAAHLRRKLAEPIPVGRPWLGREDLRRSWKPWLRGPLIGFPFGAIPAGGAEIPTFLSYVTERRLSKHKDEWGKGAIEGVAGPEATASASAAGTMVSMLTLGLPTTAVAAVMLVAFQQFGIQPGPLLFQRESALVWALIASMFIGTVLLLVLNLPLAPVWAKLLRLPRPYLYAGILFFASVGAYAVGGEVLDLVILLVIGLLGFMMRRFGLPVLPAVLGVILGPNAEQQMRRALQISDGHLSGLVNTTFSVIVYGIIAVIVCWPLLRRLRS